MLQLTTEDLKARDWTRGAKVLSDWIHNTDQKLDFDCDRVVFLIGRVTSVKINPLKRKGHP